MKRFGTVCFALVLFATSAYADPRSELAQARHDLAVSEQVLARVSAQADMARADPAVGPQEHQRLDDYLAHVRELVAQNHKRVRELEEAVTLVPAGVPGSGSGAIGRPAAATPAEDVAALDSKLSGSLSDFDQLLLEEARKAQARAPSAPSASAYAGGADESAGARSKGTKRTETKESSRGSTASAPGDGGSPAQQQEKAGTSGPGSPGGRVNGDDPGTPGATAEVPPDVGDGNDDDIVARQIRKAAESETDPELRKKLWDEYRKYKQGARG